MTKSAAGRGQTSCLPCPDRKTGYSGAPCSRLSTSHLCRLSVFLRRRWWNSCLTCSASFVRSHLIPSRLSKCPRSCLRTFPCERQLASRSWRNSWWKCQRSYPTPCLQLFVEQNVDFPVPGRGGRIAGLQGLLPGQSSTALHGSQERFSERIVEQNVDFPVGGGPSRVPEALDEPGEGFLFRTLLQVEKSAKRGSHSRSELSPRL